MLSIQFFGRFGKQMSEVGERLFGKKNYSHSPKHITEWMTKKQKMLTRTFIWLRKAKSGVVSVSEA